MNCKKELFNQAKIKEFETITYTKHFLIIICSEFKFLQLCSLVLLPGFGSAFS
jgi:hypothetical protein